MIELDIKENDALRLSHFYSINHPDSNVSGIWNYSGRIRHLIGKNHVLFDYNETNTGHMEQLSIDIDYADIFGKGKYLPRRIKESIRIAKSLYRKLFYRKNFDVISHMAGIDYGEKAAIGYEEIMDSGVTSYQALKSFHLYNVLHKYIAGRDRLRIIEIGPGSGWMVKTILERHPGSTFYLIELPQCIVYSYVALKHWFPDIKISLPGDDRGSSQIIYVDKNSVTESKCDIAIQAAGFQEMNYDLIGEYFSIMRKNLSGENHFLSSNRYSKNMKFEDGIVEHDKYPWDKSDIFYEKFEDTFYRNKRAYITSVSRLGVA